MPSLRLADSNAHGYSNSRVVLLGWMEKGPCSCSMLLGIHKKSHIRFLVIARPKGAPCLSFHCRYRSGRVAGASIGVCVLEISVACRAVQVQTSRLTTGMPVPIAEK